MNALNQAAAQELQRLSQLEALSHYTPETLLEAFLHAHNQQTQEWNALVEENQALTVKVADLESLAIDAQNYANQIIEMEKEIGALQEENEFCRNMALEAEKIAKAKIKRDQEYTALARQLELSSARVKELQRQLTELKGSDNPQKLREQIQRVKEKSKERDAKITRLERTNQQLKDSIKTKDAQMVTAIDKIKRLEMEIRNGGFTGIYHEGDHHIILWPQMITSVNKETGQAHTSRALLHMHQSGTARLISYDDETHSVLIHKAPTGGVRIPKDVLQFAENWLFNVNVTQKGEVTPKDLVQINLNAEAA